jgi:uncharacterized YccA/Bax inhibitor family protein
MRFGSPVLDDMTFERFGLNRRDFLGELAPAEPMTTSGTAAKTLLLLLLAFGSAWFTWSHTFPAPGAPPWAAIPWAFGGLGASFVLSWLICRHHTTAPMLVPLHALTEGVLLGGLSVMAESRFPGIVIQAVHGAYGTLLTLLVAYQTGLIRPTEGFKLFVTSAMSGVCCVTSFSLITRLNGFPVPYIHGSGPIGIVFCCLLTILAAMSLIITFNRVQTMALRGAPRHLEWYGAFALMTSITWLYVQMLRLLSRLKGST